MTFPAARPRRLRRTPAVRRLTAQARLSPADLVLPMFVKEGIDAPAPVTSMLMGVTIAETASRSCWTNLAQAGSEIGTKQRPTQSRRGSAG